MPDSAHFNDDFGRWYRSLDIGSDPQLIERRKKGIAGLVQQANAADVEALVRVAFKSQHVADSDALARLRRPLKDADDGFPMQGNDRELQVLSAAALAELFRQPGDLAATAALSVSAGALGGLRRLDLPLDLAGAAEAAIDKQGEERRQQARLQRRSAPSFSTTEYDKATAAVRSAVDTNTAIAAFSAVTTAARAAFSELTSYWSQSVGDLQALLAVQDEELQMLWWLVGERSWDFDCPFRSVAPGARPLVFAKELAGLTAFLPGPRSVRALLSRCGVTEEQSLTVAACVNAGNLGWQRRLLQGPEPSPVTRPIHFAICRHLETGEDTAWVAGWAAAAGVGATDALPAVKLGLLFYRERLLTVPRTTGLP